jgi:hypothetical protein
MHSMVPSMDFEYAFDGAEYGFWVCIRWCRVWILSMDLMVPSMDFEYGFDGVASRLVPSISRLAVLDRRLPFFHLLACPRACGVWLPRWRWEGRNVRACEWCLDCLCRLAPCSSTERSAGNPRRLL